MAERRRRRRRRDLAPAAAALERFRAGRAGRGAPSGELAAAALAWAKVVGAPAARHSVPVRRSRAGVVTVACSGAAWAQELAARREELLARLREACPECRAEGLRFAVADHAVAPADDPPDPSARTPPAPGPPERAEGARAAAGVADPRLRQLVARAAAAAAARRRRGR